MNYKMMGKFFSLILAVEAVFMLPALGISLYDRTEKVTYAFLITIGVIIAIAAILTLLSKGANKKFFSKEGMVCVGLGWIFMSLLGCLPFWISGEIPSYIDALFEMVSGFTTTGASVIPDLNVISRANMYWRSFSHWVGGMGVLVFLLAIVPSDGKNEGFTMHLLRAESPGPNVGKLVPKMRQTAAVLYLTYLALTVITFIFLVLGEMDAFEALCTTFGTAGTGGFGIRNDSLAGCSTYTQIVCTVFMFLFGINFSCYYLILLRRFKDVFRDEELKLYIGIVLGSITLITINIMSLYSSFGEALKHSAFQVSSIITTTGFATTDFNLWPAFSKAILLVLMLIGACAGSTGGGFKCARILLLFKCAKRNFAQMIHPKKVQVIRVNQTAMEERLVANTNAYLGIYVLIIFISFLLVSLDGFNIETNLSAVIACFNNIGPGFGAVGPTSNFYAYGSLSKMILILDMLAGRLEIFPILVLFSAKTWKKA